MKNTGGSKIPLRAKTLRVETFNANDLDKKGRPEWREIAHGPVFKEHAWIESQETIADDVLIPTPEFETGIVAIRVTCKVWEVQKEPRWYRREPPEAEGRDGAIQWTAKSIIPLGIQRETKERANERAEA